MIESVSSAKPSGNLPWIDLIRGIAALPVMLGHLRGQFFVRWDELHDGSQTILNYIVFAFTRMGREAVIVFFVLSGYLVGGNALKQLLAGNFRLRRYTIARLSRLYTVLLPALALTWFCDTLRLRVAPSFGKDWSMGLTTFFLNLGFLQGVCSPTFGSNAPLWSLGYQFWYYLFFGALLAVMTGSRRLLSLAGIAGALISLLVMPRGCLLLLPIWLVGAAAYFVRIRWSLFWGLLFLAIWAVAVGLSLHRENLLTDYLVGFAFVPVLLWLLGLPRSSDSILQRSGSCLASFSYTLYANHYPMLGLLLVILVPVRLQDAGLAQWVILGGIAVLILAINYGLYLCFERNTKFVRNYLSGVFAG